MAIVETIPERCKRCYACVRECPAKAIKVQDGQATVIESRCIACGNCVKVCIQQAKHIKNDCDTVQQMLEQGETVIACVAPSFPAACDRTTNPAKIISAIRELGFKEVWEVAVGAELVSRAYKNLLENEKDPEKVWITTACPAIISIVEKHYTSLMDNLAPVVSPMIAAAQVIREYFDEKVRVVFIGPCIAKKNEILDEPVTDQIDAVLTFEELDELFEMNDIVPENLEPSVSDGPRPGYGRAFPISGGLLKTAGIDSDILNKDVVIVEGKDRILECLTALTRKESNARFYDLLFCEGCINGPRMTNNLSVFLRKERVANYVNQMNASLKLEDILKQLEPYYHLDLSRTFQRQDEALPLPSDDKIEEVLRSINKWNPEDQLNCGACGYPSCREKAIAVCQGLAEKQMCLPYLVDAMESTLQQLIDSHQKLERTQAKLIQTERLASMGQLSAGVAHEINNPLGTILLYSHMILKDIQDKGDSLLNEDLTMIVNEATRCKDIVRGLLDFARQSRVEKTPSDLISMVKEVVATQEAKAKEAQITLKYNVEKAIPEMHFDKTQLKQALVNIVANAIDATQPSGSVSVQVGLNRREDSAEIRVKDTGCGIPKENIDKLFTPFFSTKANDKGTGLGLAITYGIIKMHSGQIHVESEEGKGTTFIITLPLIADSNGSEPNQKEETFF